ncbi:PspC domain-containing protein [Winogradskyella aquimaris]|jgi:phage shock protein PspC (stress-responsive transcriptional regulator)|uniref:PspC domain-containing protein n=1 Tax=Winogradskyella aquimaris TaxID=864074 RepID=A0ABU5EST9_9FLAO|nr:PspC domain-containing protein [Winogradskyella aquimaris]MDY2587834.1 PspC domain-containing protein [Winogradskyella aquimaris]
MNWFYTLLYYFQKRGYHVCQRIADRLGIRAKIVRTSFMYLTFVTVGFGFALYLFLAFWMRIKDIIYTKRSSVFDL